MLRFAAIPALFLLAACNTAAPPPAPGVVSNITPSTFAMPAGGGCAGEVSRFQAVLDNDLATGNVAKRVHDSASGDVAEARAACSAGNESAAIGRIAATKAKFGYR